MLYLACSHSVLILAFFDRLQVLMLVANLKASGLSRDPAKDSLKQFQLRSMSKVPAQLRSWWSGVGLNVQTASHPTTR